MTDYKVICRAQNYLLRLPDDVNRIWQEVEDLTGKGFLLVPDARIEEYANATVRLAGPGDPLHVVRYSPHLEEHLPYYLAHEAGHILRFFRGPEDMRRLPTVTNEQRRSVGYELKDHLFRLADRGMPEEALGHVLKMWHDGVVRQVNNMPVDMRIERWMYESYEGLRPAQRRALRRQVEQNAEGLKPAVQAFTPKKVYDASVTMNSAFASYLGWLLDDRRMRQPYVRTPYYRRGERMARSIWSSPDGGQQQDIETVNRWAEELGVSSWFEWVSVADEEVQLGH
ncbi:MAG: hypothetical protein HY051_02920 [Candidatus Aenigmarchaeota archaeon]|nr:hypothetical protein [Candidatus Aenigmarchaeota archaeon]